MSVLRLPPSWQDWHITGELGEGAYGRVYRAEKEDDPALFCVYLGTTGESIGKYRRAFEQMLDNAK